MIGTHSRRNRHSTNHFSNFIVIYYENIGSNATGEIIFEEKNIDQHIKLPNNIPFFSNDFNIYPYNIKSPHPSNSIGTPHNFEAFSPLIGNHYINDSNHQILLML